MTSETGVRSYEAGVERRIKGEARVGQQTFGGSRIEIGQTLAKQFCGAGAAGFAVGRATSAACAKPTNPHAANAAAPSALMTCLARPEDSPLRPKREGDSLC